MTPLRKCKKCGLEANTEEELELFVTANNGSLYGKTQECKECNSRDGRKYRKLESTQKASRKNHLKKTYGITLEEYDDMFNEQEGRCKICGTTDSQSSSPHFHVDHCHSSGIVRGLLCGPCNQGLGQFKDNIPSLEAAIKYLKENKK